MKYELSEKNLEKIKKFIEIILIDEIELKGVKPEMGIKIPVEKLENPEEIQGIVTKINEGEKHKIINYLFSKNRSFLGRVTRDFNDIKNELPRGSLSEERDRYFLKVSIFDIKKLKEIDYKINKKYNEEIKNPDSLSYWVTKYQNGYFYNNKLLRIKNTKADYFVIFDVVYSLIGTESNIEYEKIMELCKKRNLPKMSRKKIQRALTGESATFFNHVKEIDRILPGGVSLFEASPEGKFLIFNNKK